MLQIVRLLSLGAVLVASPAGADTLRAGYLASNPTQATRDPATGKPSGPSYDLARELARRAGRDLVFEPMQDPNAVIDAVRSGTIDIGFVAREATRLGTVDFSQTYMLVRQSFLVLDGVSIRRVADIDQPGRTIAGTQNDSITLCLRRILRHARLLELPNDPAELSHAFEARTVDAFAANRQRLAALMRRIPGTRMLEDDLFSVPQNVAVAKDQPATLAAVNALIDEVRASGALGRSLEQAGAAGVAMAPPDAVAGCPEKSAPP